MNYKESIFNIDVTNETKGVFIVYNTKSGHYVIIDEKERKRFMDLIHGESDNPIIRDYLASNGILVNGDEDECSLFLDSLPYERTFFLTLLPTTACNFRCPYCFESHDSARVSPKMEELILHFLAQKLSYYHHLNVQWYGGEPLLEIELIKRLSEKMIRMCKDRRITYTANMTTNGFLLSWENYQLLKECKIRNYTITVDGVKEHHNRTRILPNGTGTFSTIVDNLKKIREMEKSQLSHFTIRTNFTYNSIEKKDEWENYLNEHFLFDSRFSYLPRYAWNNSKSTLSKNQFIEFEYNGNVDTSEYSDLESHEYEKLIIDKSEKRLALLHNRADVCMAGHNNSIIIAPDGRLLKCQVCLDDPTNVVGQLDESTGSVWIDEKNQSKWEVRDMGFEECKTCWSFPFCLGKGCAAKTINPVVKKEKWCNLFQAEIKKHLMIISNKEKTIFPVSKNEIN